MRLATILSILAVGCSGAGAAVGGLDQAATNEPPTTASSTPSDEQKPSTIVAPTEQDAGSVADSSIAVEAGQDAGQDAAVDVIVPPVPRYGVAFDDAANTRLKADLPDNFAGQQHATFEGWFSLRQLTEAGLFFTTHTSYCAVATTGAYTGRMACCPTLNGVGCAYSTTLLPIGKFFHLAWVFDFGTWNMYIDGKFESSVVAPKTELGTPQAPFLLFGDATFLYKAAMITVDEFRISYTARYVGVVDFAPPKHLVSDGKVTYMLDEGAGLASGNATLMGDCRWVSVAR